MNCRGPWAAGWGKCGTRDFSSGHRPKAGAFEPGMDSTLIGFSPSLSLALKINKHFFFLSFTNYKILT